jgi:hypothetical protein
MWRAARHRGGASCRNTDTGLAYPGLFEPPHRGLWLRLPLLIQGGEPFCRVLRQKLANFCYPSGTWRHQRPSCPPLLIACFLQHQLNGLSKECNLLLDPQFPEGGLLREFHREASLTG